MIILAADIGGTHSRFAVFDRCAEDRLCLQQTCWLATGDVDNFGQLVDHLRKSELAEWLACCRSVAIAVPGPVRNGKASNLPNVSWSLSTSQLQECFPRTPKESVHLINDFVAHVLACRTPAMANAICIQAGEKAPAGVVSAIGAGTGLGFCSLVPCSEDGHLVLPSEAGHQSFIFSSEDERRYEDFLRKETGQSTIDGNTVVSGRGLALLYRFVTGKDLLPQDVAERLGAKSEVSRLFATYYGRAARDYVLTVLSTGGLYVTGGIAARNRFLVDHDAFRAEFSASPAHQALLEKIPIHLNINEESGIWGAAGYALMRSKKGRC